MFKVIEGICLVRTTTRSQNIHVRVHPTGTTTLTLGVSVLLDIPDGVHLVDELVRADLVLVEAPVRVRLHRELERLTSRRVDEPHLGEC